MPKRIARITHERRYVIIKLPREWEPGDALPPAGPEDQWFDSFLPFIAVWRGPYEPEPIERQPSLQASTIAHDQMNPLANTLDD
jgi:hypothetical protein